MIVLKFGGSSVKNKENILKVKNILASQYEGSSRYTVVVSAFGGVTDQLIEMSDLAAKGKSNYQEVLEAFKTRHLATAKELLKSAQYKAIVADLNENHSILSNLLHGIYLVRECSPRTLDYVLSFGERNSAFIISKALTQHGITSEYLDARNIIKTDKTFNNANVNFKLTEKAVKAHYKSHKSKVQIVTGFIASDVGGLTTTLGRGGSDYTASILASCLNAKKLEIWTDVDGVLTTDPRKVKKSFTVPKLSYREAMELSHFGAKVIYPPTIQPSLQKNIPIYIRNTFNPEFAGTQIDNNPASDNTKAITGLSSLSGISLLRLQGGGMVGIPGIAARLFSALAQESINIILITQGSSEYAISFAVKSGEEKLAKKTIEKAFSTEIAEGTINEILVEKDLCVLAIVSEHMRNQPGVAGKLFSALGKEGINVVAIAQGSSEYNISFVISKNEETKALNLIHDSFFLSEHRDIHLFMIGVGLIGGTLIKQIQEHYESLRSEKNIDIKITGLSNSKTMLLDSDGIQMKKWKNALTAASQKSNPKKFVQQMIDMNLPNSIFLDNTANADIPELYETILENNISIVTPNKVATSSNYSRYLKLKSLAKQKKADFLYETNVGAGLPVITTLQNLISSGDTITSLQAVLSGSISYIFNTFGDGLDFSEVVLKAKQIGLTEPDPRDDLSGMDVKRKITILAREAGYKMNMSQVKLKPILNKACLTAKSIDDFFIELKKMDAQFNKMHVKAAKSGNKLRFLASLENGKCAIGLQEVTPQSPFYNLQGSDNMLVIHTNRYQERPLVIKGPGAGADVTAAGIFAEIVSIANNLI